MIATLRLRGHPDPSFSATGIYQALNEHNVKYGVDQQAIEKIVHAVKNSIEPVHLEEIVARGQRELIYRPRTGLLPSVAYMPDPLFRR